MSDREAAIQALRVYTDALKESLRAALAGEKQDPKTLPTLSANAGVVLSMMMGVFPDGKLARPEEVRRVFNLS